MQDVNKVRIKPLEGMQVRKQNGQILNPDGELVILNSYYRRRLKDGDLLLVEDKKAAKAAAKKIETQGDK
ncbi:hypothetical protein TW85_21985 [Marinomonas sp. S3726]|uniref:DUF2635 domain-containing protein n=1 Tax=Marinomonas sp. S3726 TaxID=579484 RepID=UPI0005FA1ABE|nr:DUF2635 domain-containing protein [Marinomonas sp. S3726]KJZ09489.1 hypothetical protein TW85_21985 [Marinomonas sp. S3726]